MRCLVVKTSSLGDLIHTFPALSDASEAISNIEFDWVVEEAFADIPKLHPKVKNTIPLAVRRWRKAPFLAQHRHEIKTFIKTLRAEQYDLIIDAQGLVKSAFITSLCKGTKHGLSFNSAREPISAWAYQNKHSVAKGQHAIQRTRDLFAQSLAYPYKQESPNYGLSLCHNPRLNEPPTILFLHGTTWQTKEWPENYWLQLAKLCEQKGFEILLPWGNVAEKARGERIACQVQGARLLPKMGLADLYQQLTQVNAIVAVDTGIGHLAAALEIPTLSLYGATDKTRTGTLGKNQRHLQSTLACAPCLKRHCRFEKTSDIFPKCFESIPPNQVFNGLIRMMEEDSK